MGEPDAFEGLLNRIEHLMAGLTWAACSDLPNRNEQWAESRKRYMAGREELLAMHRRAASELRNMVQKHALVCDRMMLAERRVHQLREALWPFVDNLETRWEHHEDPSKGKEVYCEVELVWMRNAKAAYHDSFKEPTP